MSSPRQARKPQELNGREMVVNFSEPVKEAFGDLAAAVRFSDHFGYDIKPIVLEWGAGQRVSVHDFLIAFPTIADETFKHVQATGDQQAKAAWETIVSQIPNQGYTLTDARGRGR